MIVADFQLRTYLRQDSLRLAYAVLLFAIWTLSLGSYRPAGREMPHDLSSVDPIALFKVVTRVLSFLMLGYAMLKSVRSSRFQFAIIRHRLFPLALFASWAILTALWSPLKAFSLGKSFGLPILLMITAVTALLCAQEQRFSGILYHLSLAYLFISIANLLGYVFFPMDGIDPRGGLFMQKNEAAQVADLGILIPFLCWFNFPWRWIQKVIIPAFLVHTIVIILANSRTATFTLVFVLAVSLWFYLDFKRIMVVALIPSVLLLIVFFHDSFANSVDAISSRVVTYIMRGQTQDEFTYFTGRPDKWKLAFQGFMESPIIGNGYDVTNTTGYQFLYGREEMMSAHNLFLFILAGTGLVGMALFLWGIGHLLLPLLCCLRGPMRGLSLFVLLALLWFFSVGVMELSFLSSVGMPGIGGFIMLGIAIGIECRHKILLANEVQPSNLIRV
jgi:O-antigen ligase